MQVHAVAAAALVPAGFTAAEGPDGTLLRVEAGSGGELAVTVSRVLRDDAAREQDGDGYVTAPWRRPDGSAVRSVFATATLHGA